MLPAPLDSSHTGVAPASHIGQIERGGKIAPRHAGQRWNSSRPSLTAAQ
jgi:hypothetical protein